jgi:catechol 2,3-dioxygenase-like lactoylglutathione lyase family enzyme
MKIQTLDHLVITTTDIEQIFKFYTRVLGMEAVGFNDGRKALRFGKQKINLHKIGAEFTPHAMKPTPGSTDICLITDTPMHEVVSHLASCNVKIIEGPVKRIGASGPLLSIYIHDPDGNLIELANQGDD